MEKRVNKTAPANALQKPATRNPGVIAPASINNNALITKENKPNVKIVIGKEIICNTGFIKALINAITMQTNIALRKLSTNIPGINHEINIITSE